MTREDDPDHGGSGDGDGGGDGDAPDTGDGAGGRAADGDQTTLHGAAFGGGASGLPGDGGGGDSGGHGGDAPDTGDAGGRASGGGRPSGAAPDLPGVEAVPEATDNEVTHNGAPDRFLMCSGGMDSVAMTHRMLEEEWGDYGAWDKRPVVVYLETTVGLSSQRAYVQMLADEYGWHLMCLRTPESFADHSVAEGFHGPQQHDRVFTLLKGRQVDKLASAAGNPNVYWGSRVAEKGDHVERVEYRDDIGAWSHNPLYDWGDGDVVAYLRDRDVPFNPNWEAAHFTDCGCGATAAHEELIEVEAEGYEVFADKLRALQDRVETGDRRETWAWGSFAPDDRRVLDARNDPDQTHLGDLVCGPNCSGRSLLAGPDSDDDGDGDGGGDGGGGDPDHGDGDSDDRGGGDAGTGVDSRAP